MKSAIVALATLMTASCSSLLIADQPAESEPLICQCIEDLRCATIDMKDEIKTHFRGTRGYGRMLATNALLRVKAAAIQRRLNRDLCYRRLERDVARLNELACELQERFDEILACSSYNRPVCGDVGHVQAKIDNIRGLASCVQIEACRSLGLAAPEQFFAPALAPTMAPGAPVIEPLEFVPQIETAVPHSSMRSVLETQEPMIILPEEGGK